MMDRNSSNSIFPEPSSSTATLLYCRTIDQLLHLLAGLREPERYERVLQLINPDGAGASFVERVEVLPQFQQGLVVEDYEILLAVLLKPAAITEPRVEQLTGWLADAEVVRQGDSAASR